MRREEVIDRIREHFAEEVSPQHFAVTARKFLHSVVSSRLNNPHDGSVDPNAFANGYFQLTALLECIAPVMEEPPKHSTETGI